SLSSAASSLESSNSRRASSRAVPRTRNTESCTGLPHAVHTLWARRRRLSSRTSYTMRCQCLGSAMAAPNSEGCVEGGLARPLFCEQSGLELHHPGVRERERQEVVAVLFVLPALVEVDHFLAAAVGEPHLSARQSEVFHRIEGAAVDGPEHRHVD